MKIPLGAMVDRFKRTPAAVNFGWLTMERGTRMIISLVLGVWTARVLGPDDYGRLNAAFALVALIAVLPTWGLDQILRRELVLRPHESGRLLGTVFLLRLASGMVCYVALGAFVLTTGSTAAPAGVVLIIGLTILQPGVQTIDGWFHARLEARSVVFAQNLALLSAGAFRAAILIWKPELHLIVLAMVIDVPLAGILMMRSYRQAGERLSSWRFDPPLARALTKEAVPLLLTALAITVYHRIDQVLLPSLAGVTATGHYAAAVRIVEMWYFVPTALAASWAPTLVRAHAQGPMEFEATRRRQFARYAAFAWALTLATAATSPWLLPWLFGPAYAPAGIVAALLSFALPFVALGVARGEAWIVLGRSHRGLMAAVMGAIANIALVLWWIPRWGAMGAAAATVVSYAVAGIGSTFCWAAERGMGREQLHALTLRGLLWDRA